MLLKMSGKVIGKDFLAQKVTLAGRPENGQSDRIRTCVSVLPKHVPDY